MLIECHTCNALVKGEEVGHYINENPYDFLLSQKYTLCKCPQCLSPLLVEEELHLDSGLNETFWDKVKTIYPTKLFHINPVIPEKLQKALLECIQCYKAGANTATAIMCRRTLEGFCKLKGAEEKNLEKSIKKLKDDGSINEQLYEWANQLRLVGNEAAHDIESEFFSLDAKDILDFTIAILDFTYSFKDKFDRFKERRIKKVD
jgi:Domain of unknown function (DUF4145)